MSNRNPLLYLNDIIEAIEAVESYITADTNIDDFIGDRKTYSATIREFIIIGEAINSIIQLFSEQKVSVQNELGGKTNLLTLLAADIVIIDYV